MLGWCASTTCPYATAAPNPYSYWGACHAPPYLGRCSKHSPPSPSTMPHHGAPVHPFPTSVRREFLPHHAPFVQSPQCGTLVSGEPLGGCAFRRVAVHTPAPPLYTPHHTTPHQSTAQDMCSVNARTPRAHPTPPYPPHLTSPHRTADFFEGHPLPERTNTESRAHTCSTTCLERKLFYRSAKSPFVFLRRVIFLLSVLYISLGKTLCE